MTVDRTSTLLASPHRPALRTFLSIFALAIANEAFDWRLTGDYDWEWIVAMVMLGANLLPFVLLTGRRRQRELSTPSRR